MIAEYRNRLHRCAPTLAEDAVGVVALVVMFMVALHLPLWV
ncbi:MAG: hypothetical protein ACXIU8_07260 [Alkalilacustris sp.]